MFFVFTRDTGDLCFDEFDLVKKFIVKDFKQKGYLRTDAALCTTVFVHPSSHTTEHT